MAIIVYLQKINVFNKFRILTRICRSRVESNVSAVRVNFLPGKHDKVSLWRTKKRIVQDGADASLKLSEDHSSVSTALGCENLVVYLTAHNLSKVFIGCRGDSIPGDPKKLFFPILRKEVLFSKLIVPFKWSIDHS